MKTVIMTSASFQGSVTFEYGANCNISRVTLSEDNTLNDKQVKWLFANLPWNENMLDDFAKNTQNCTFSYTDREVTFEMFWNRYNDRSRSSKKKTEAKWNKMPLQEQIKAYFYIPTYLRNKGNAELKYAETYLNAELWNN